MSKNQILASIKGRNSVANRQQTTIYDTNIDLVNDDLHTKFGFILSIRSQDIEQKPKSDYNQLVLKKKQILTSIKSVTLLQICEKTKIYNTNVDLVNDNVYTKFGLNLSIPSQDIEQKPNSDVNQGP